MWHSMHLHLRSQNVTVTRGQRNFFYFKRSFYIYGTCPCIMHGNGTEVYQGMSEGVGWPVQTFHGADFTESTCFEGMFVFLWCAYVYVCLKHDSRKCIHPKIPVQLLTIVQDWIKTSRFCMTSVWASKECFQCCLFFQFVLKITWDVVFSQILMALLLTWNKKQTHSCLSVI